MQIVDQVRFDRRRIPHQRQKRERGGVLETPPGCPCQEYRGGRRIAALRRLVEDCPLGRFQYRVEAAQDRGDGHGSLTFRPTFFCP